MDRYKLMRYIKLQHRLVRAQWLEPAGKWILTIRRSSGTSDEYEDFEDTADVLFTGFGGLSRWKWPDIEGLESFQGKLIHSADWRTGEGDPDGPWEESVKSWKDKNVGVIGIVCVGHPSVIVQARHIESGIGIFCYSNRASFTTQGSSFGKLCSRQDMDISELRARSFGSSGAKGVCEQLLE